jgi:pimeloyl-ACP methyl ester carboxylesterase
MGNGIRPCSALIDVPMTCVAGQVNRPWSYNAKRDLDVFADWQEYFRKEQPPMLITWGKNDGIFTVEGAELLKRDIPSAELHLLDTGHFALEEEVDRIGSLMHEFLDPKINKK